MKKKLAIGGAILLAIVTFCGFQTAPILSAAYWPNSFTAGTMPLVSGYISGVPVMAPSGLVDNGSALAYKGSPIAAGSLATLGIRTANTAASTTATTLAVTMTGVSTSSQCTFAPANSSAATQLPTISLITHQQPTQSL